jgi:hypothetical protein
MNNALQEHLDSFMRLNIFSQLNTGYQVIDMLMSTLFMMYIPTIFTWVSNNISNIGDYVRYYRSNKLTLEGLRSVMVGWSARTQNIFSMRFRALWYHIQIIQDTEKSIHSIKEYPSSENSRDEYDDTTSSSGEGHNKTDNDIFIVNQRRPFNLGNDIWCKVSTTHDDMDQNSRGGGQGQPQSSKLERISIVIYSHTKTVHELQLYIDGITDNYMDNLYLSRRNQLFIYSLLGFSNKNETELMSPIWDECRFKSSRQFNTIFFDQKAELLRKVDFFENNKSWYDKEGHPHTIGIGIHGPPGTGKTSIIKSLANHLKRHMIVIPLSKVKTQNQFHKCFFDNEYSHKNAKQGIGFEKKIIVFEDIDCMSNIIMERNMDNNTNTNSHSSSRSSSSHKNDNNTTISKDELLQTIKDGMNPDHCNESTSFLKKDSDDKDDLTLSFILNVIDGIRETPGRILIITSNYYSKLDKALTRPGRIDVSLEMTNASISVIEEVVQHYYDTSIPDTIRAKLRDGIVSPATLVNLRFKADNVTDYLDMLVREYFTHI